MTDDSNSNSNPAPSQGNVIRKLAEYLACAPGTLKRALEHQAKIGSDETNLPRIGQILQELGIISAEELESAIRRQRADRLRQCYVFSSLTQPELTALSMRFREVTVPEGYQFIIQDEEDPTLYVLASGKAEVYRTDIDGNWLHIAYLEQSEPIGEMGYFDPSGRRSASVRAVERSELLCASYSDLTHYFENVPRVANDFMKLVKKRKDAIDELLHQAT
ncbi:MAG: cyclic nucleotide-binding domain-containing protein [Gammaproteobacteria bacterium]